MNIFKPKYKFNPDTLQYEKIEFNLKRFLIKSIPHIALTLVFAAILITVFSMFFDTPKERFLKSENNFLKSNLRQINSRLVESDSMLTKLALRDNYFYRITYNQDTIPLAIRSAGVGGVDRYRHLDGFETSDLVKNVAMKLDQVEKKLNIQALSYNELYDAVKQYDKKLGSLPFLQPIHTNELTRIGSFYGYRVHPVMRVRHLHEGVDFTAPTGTPIYASGDGVIITVEESRARRGYGNLVIIDHGVKGITTRYAHLYSIAVEEGQEVKRGQKIGTVGNTGMSTAPHLHYEVRINGASVNPLRYMLTPSPDEFDEIIKLANYDGVSFD